MFGDLGKIVDFAPPKVLFDAVTGKETAATDMIPGIGDKFAQDKANAANIAQADINRRFQENMSNTAYQRAMADMRAAGLNPTLAFSQGGASTPSGSVANVSPASSTGAADFALRATTGISAAQQQASAVQSQIGVNESAKTLNTANAAKSLADAEKSRVETRIRRAEVPAADVKNDLTGRIGSLVTKAADAFTKSAQDLQTRVVRYHQLNRDEKATADSVRKLHQKGMK